MPYTGDLTLGNQFFFLTTGPNGTWGAGFPGAAVTLRYESWSNTQIVIDGFSGAYGQNGWIVIAGHPYTIGTFAGKISGTLPSGSGSSIASTTTAPTTVATFRTTISGNPINYNEITTQYTYLKNSQTGEISKVYLTPAQTQVAAGQSAALQAAVQSTNPYVRQQAQQYIAQTQAQQAQIQAEYAAQTGG